MSDSRTRRRNRRSGAPVEPQPLDPREGKRLALVVVPALLRTILEGDRADLVRRALIADGQDPAQATLDIGQAGDVLYAKVGEVIVEVQRRADGYKRTATRKSKDPAEVDDFLVALHALGVVDDVVITSRGRAHRHGQHAVQWRHADGTPDTAEGGTARTALRRAHDATQGRLRKNRGRRGRAQ